MSVDDLTQIGWVRVGGVLRAPAGIREPKSTELAKFKEPATGAVRKTAPCGTPAAYRRHRKRGETCERCERHKVMNATRAGTR